MTDNKKTTRPRRCARAPRPDGTAAILQETSPPSPPVQPTAEAAAKPDSKIAKVIALLKRTEGATLEEMVGATGWLPHTTRAALTGLKKKGHTIERAKRADMTCYWIMEAA